jgi:hypothetical protein
MILDDDPLVDGTQGRTRLETSYLQTNVERM